MALGISFGFVTVYYLFLMIEAITVQKFLGYDKPQGMFYKIIDAPVALPGFVFDLAVPKAIRKRYFSLKPGYLRRAGLCFILNVMLYSVPAYFVLHKMTNSGTR